MVQKKNKQESRLLKNDEDKRNKSCVNLCKVILGKKKWKQGNRFESIYLGLGLELGLGPRSEAA